jgi:hypothetical protein
MMRNPWGFAGTEYFYNQKTRTLDRRSVPEDRVEKTFGYTLVELSDFMLGFYDLYIGRPGEPNIV